MVRWVAIAIAMCVCASVAARAQGETPSWQRVELGAGAQRYPFAIYSNHAWEAGATDVRSAVVVIHGQGRNGAGYFSTGDALARRAGGRTLVIAPNYFTAEDAKRHAIEGLPLWRASQWNHGADAVNWPWALSSFQVIDDVLRALLDTKRYPRIERIVLAGHSGGGQLAHRYAVLNSMDEAARRAGRPIRYVVANPSSYLYLTPERPAGAGFTPYDAALCPDYNRYRYGLDGLDNLVRHAAQVVREENKDLFMRFAGREVVYLLGGADNDPNHAQLDKSCGAQAGGAHRLERGKNYIRYEQYLAKTGMILNRRAFEVIGIGHSQARMFTSQCAAELLYGLAADQNAAGAACRVP